MHFKLHLPLLTVAALVATGCSTTTPPAATAAAGTAAVTQSVGTTGATVKTGSAQVIIPAGALTAAQNVSVGKAQAAGVAKMPTVIAAAGDPYTFKPHGTTFANPVTIELPFTGTGNVVLRLDDEADTSWEAVDGATFANGIATFKTSKFSIYIVGNTCSPLCTAGAPVCVGKPNAVPNSHGACTSRCQSESLSASTKSCTAQTSALYACYIGAPTSNFECDGGYPWPKTSACATEVAAVQACLNPIPAAPACPALTGLKSYAFAKPNGFNRVNAVAFGSLSKPVAVAALPDVAVSINYGPGADFKAPPNQIGVYRNDGSGKFTFKAVTTGVNDTTNECGVGVGPELVASESAIDVGDLDGDGYRDVVYGLNTHLCTENSGGTFVQKSVLLRAAWVRNKGAAAPGEMGTPQAVAVNFVPPADTQPATIAVRIADVDGSGTADLVLLTDPGVSDGAPKAPELGWISNLGWDAAANKMKWADYAVLTWPASSGSTSKSGDAIGRAMIHAADVNGDGLVDLMVSGGGGGGWPGVLLHGPKGSATFTAVELDAGFRGIGHLADVNGDAKADMVFQRTNSTGDLPFGQSITAMLQTATGLSATGALTLLVGDAANPVMLLGAANFDASGSGDLLVMAFPSAKVQIRQWGCTGSAAVEVPRVSPPDYADKAEYYGAVDLDGDGKLDLMFGDYEPQFISRK